MVVVVKSRPILRWTPLPIFLLYVLHVLSLFIIAMMWSVGGMVESSPLPGRLTNQPKHESLSLLGILKGKLDHRHPPDTGAGADDQNAVQIQRAMSKVGKRDLWELVSASSDVIPIESENDKNFTTSSSSASRLYAHPSSSSSAASSTDSRKLMLSDTISSHQDVQMRLNKLEYYFGGLRIFEEDCRQRLICEISQDPPKFAPLSAAFMDETSYHGDDKMLTARLLTSNEGTRLLTYIEASQRGLNREGCDVWAYRCPQTTETLINFQSLLTWREVLKWLTVKMVAKRF